MHKTERYKENPFIKGMIIPIGTKNIQISTLGKDKNVLVNQHTGEVSGTHVIARKRVDKERFIKTFSDYMGYTFDLTKAGNKALRIVMWALQEQPSGKDKVFLDRHTFKAFLEVHDFSEDISSSKPSLSYPTFTRGLGELEKAQIIAKTVRPGQYFINPNCMFNGDRIAFTTLIEKNQD